MAGFDKVLYLFGDSYQSTESRTVRNVPFDSGNGQLISK